MTVEIRNCTLNDVEVAAQLMGELGYPTTNEDMKERLEAILSDSSYCTLAAQAGDQVIGLVGMQKSYLYERNGMNVRIIAMIVHHEFRGQEIGRQLIEAAEKWAKDQGATSISLNSGNRLERAGAHRFYEHLGFEPKSTGFAKLL